MTDLSLEAPPLDEAGALAFQAEVRRITDAVNGRESEVSASSGASSAASSAVGSATSGRVDMTKKPEEAAKDERPPFDADAT